MNNFFDGFYKNVFLKDVEEDKSFCETVCKIYKQVEELNKIYTNNAIQNIVFEYSQDGDGKWFFSIKIKEPNHTFYDIVLRVIAKSKMQGIIYFQDIMGTQNFLDTLKYRLKTPTYTPFHMDIVKRLY